MIKYYQWFDFDNLKAKYKDNSELIDILDSLEDKQRKCRFYEYYHVHDDVIDRNIDKINDLIDAIMSKNPQVEDDTSETMKLTDHVEDLIQDVRNLKTERDMYKKFFEEEKNKK